jgi:hypothetical protein
MSKKLEKNGLWESSRMMLPQHREAFVVSRQTQNKRDKPYLHDDEFELIVRCIKESYYTQKTIDVQWVHEQQYEYTTGNVSKIDEHSQRIKLQKEEDMTWIPFDSIVSVKNSS